MQFLDAQAVREGLSFDRLIPALEHMFVSGCEVPERTIHTIPSANGSGMTVLVMPAWQPDRYFGIKTVCVAPDNGASGLTGLFSTYLLHDACTGVPLAYIDGSELTSRRTAAASALAAKRLARADSECLLIVGTGSVSSVIAHAYREVLPITRVMVWGRSPAKARSLATALGNEGFEASAAEDLAAAVERADVVCCATLAREPLIQGEWLQPGSHLNLIGSFTPAMREADDRCFSGASVFIDTEEAMVKSGDLLSPIAAGVLSSRDIRGTLAQLCAGARPGRVSSLERTVFKSVGTALEDLVAATLLVQA